MISNLRSSLNEWFLINNHFITDNILIETHDIQELTIKNEFSSIFHTKTLIEKFDWK